MVRRVSSELIRDKTEAVASGGMVVARHPLAAEAGREALVHGGNALDAAITAALVCGVTIPNASGIGGGGYLVYYDASSHTAHAVDFAMMSPASATPGAFPLAGSGTGPALGWRRVVNDANLTGWTSVCTPGALAGFELALSRWGTRSLADALAPSINIAEEGFPLTQMVANAWVNRFARILVEPSTRDVLTREGMPYPTGERWRQPALARTMRRLAAEGAADLYRGQLARDLAADAAAHGSLLSLDDLSAYQPLASPALTGTYRGATIHAAPGANGAMGMRLALSVLEGYDLAVLAPDNPEAIHLWIEACRLAWADHFGYLAHPQDVDVPLRGLLSPEYAAARRQLIAPDKAAATYPPGDPWIHEGRTAPSTGLTPSRPWETGGTTTVSVVDQHRNVCALTNTNVGWAGVISPRTGIFLNNAMSWFDPEPGHPNSVGPRKRGLNNMSPVVLVQKGQPLAAAGATGGRQIVHTIAQVISNLVDRRVGARDAILAPKVDCTQPVTRLDARLPAATFQALESMGHRIATAPRPGAAPNVVVIDQQTGLLHGADMPHNDGVAAGYDTDAATQPD